MLIQKTICYHYTLWCYKWSQIKTDYLNILHRYVYVYIDKTYLKDLIYLGVWGVIFDSEIMMYV